MAIEPVTREERFLAAAGGQSVTPPTPITRKEQLLQGIIDAVKSGGATPDVIEGAVNDYLDANPVKPGATTEQAAQIEQNKNDIADLQTEVDELKESSGGSVDLTGVVRSVNGKTPDEKGNVEIDVSGSGQNATGGLTTAQVAALHGMFKVCAYDDNKDVSGAYAAFLAAFNLDDSGGGSEGENPGGGGSGEAQTVDLATVGDVESNTDINGNASNFYIRYTVRDIKAGDIITTHAPDKNTATGLFVADGADVTADATCTAASDQYNGTTIYVYTFVAPSDYSIFRVAARTNYVNKGFPCTITREV